MATVNGERRGLGGWLILPAFGLIGWLIGFALSLNNDFLPIFREGYWEILTTPGSEAYHHLWAPLITFEIVGNAVIMICAIILLFLFFAKSYRFPTLMIVFLASHLVFGVSDFFLADLIPAVAAAGNAGSVIELSLIIIPAMIWIPYFLVSKRVKNTFVKPESSKPLQPTAESGG